MTVDTSQLPIDVKDIIKTLDREFHRIHNDTPHVLYGDLKVGDYLIHIMGPEQVKRVTKKNVVTTHGKLWLYWTHSTVNRISEDDAKFLVANHIVYRVWMISGIEGLYKSALKAIEAVQ